MLEHVEIAAFLLKKLLNRAVWLCIMARLLASTQSFYIDGRGIIGLSFQYY